jgi:hypothetical protein
LFAGAVTGVLYTLALLRRGRIADAIVAHAVTNGLIAMDVLAFHHWELWQGQTRCRRRMKRPASPHANNIRVRGSGVSRVDKFVMEEDPVNCVTRP